MIIHALMAKRGEMGGSVIFSYVAALLATRVGHEGDEIEMISIIFYLRSPTPDSRAGLEKVSDDIHEFWNKLPKVTFHRRLKRVDIQFASKQFNSEDERGWLPSVDKCNRAMS